MTTRPPSGEGRAHHFKVVGGMMTLRTAMTTSQWSGKTRHAMPRMSTSPPAERRRRPSRQELRSRGPPPPRQCLMEARSGTMVVSPRAAATGAVAAVAEAAATAAPAAAAAAAAAGAAAAAAATPTPTTATTAAAAADMAAPTVATPTVEVLPVHPPVTAILPAMHRSPRNCPKVKRDGCRAGVGTVTRSHRRD